MEKASKRADGYCCCWEAPASSSNRNCTLYTHQQHVNKVNSSSLLIVIQESSVSILDRDAGGKSWGERGAINRWVAADADLYRQLKQEVGRWPPFLYLLSQRQFVCLFSSFWKRVVLSHFLIFRFTLAIIFIEKRAIVILVKLSIHLRLGLPVAIIATAVAAVDRPVEALSWEDSKRTAAAAGQVVWAVLMS